MTTQVDEMNFLQSLIPQFGAEGYDVYLQPSAPLVPDSWLICTLTRLQSGRAKNSLSNWSFRRVRINGRQRRLQILSNDAPNGSCGSS